MKVDNQRNTYRIWIRRLVTAILFTMSTLILIFLPWFEESEFFLAKYHVIILIAVIYIATNVFNTLKIPHFVHYSDQGEMIILRYYPLSLFTSRKNSIEIPKQQFVKYELRPFFMGEYQKIVLYQNFRNRVVSYPPISLSAVDKDDISKILASLQKYVKS
ncbi:MAG: hypothetical protein ABFS10_06150 [Bacteroidota bacterium]